MSRRRVISSVCGGAVLLVVGATAAYAAGNIVDVTSSYGSGSNAVTDYNRGPAGGRGSMTSGGFLKSATGAGVYYEGKVVYGGNTDPNCGRMFSDVTSRAGVGVSGSCTWGAQTGTYNGVAYRVCKNVSAAPDPCGSWSAASK